MTVIGYTRVSTDKQDLEKQKHLLLEYAQAQQMMIDEFIGAEVSSTQGAKERRVEELLSKLKEGDSLLVAELSRLGRNMLQTLNIINELAEKGVSLIFVRQPELSTSGPHTKPQNRSGHPSNRKKRIRHSRLETFRQSRPEAHWCRQCP